MAARKDSAQGRRGRTTPREYIDRAVEANRRRGGEDVPANVYRNAIRQAQRAFKGVTPAK